MGALIGSLSSPLYRSALDILRARVAFETGVPLDEVEANLAPILESMDDDVRGPSLPSIEARLLHADIQRRRGDAEAFQRLVVDGDALMTAIPLMPRRVAHRKQPGERGYGRLSAVGSAPLTGGSCPEGR